MNHSRTALLLSAMALTVVSNAMGQGRMMMPPPPAHQFDSLSHDLVLTQDQWISGIVAHWSGSQRRAWQSLDRTFRAWVSHLVWTSKNAGQLSDADVKSQRFQIPAGCPVAAFEAPAVSTAEAMSRLQDAMPNVNWDAWNNIEPTFRGVAEWEFSVLHAKAQRSAAQKSWWELNDNQVRECLELSVSPATRTVSSIQTASAKPALPQNPRYEQIERREKLEREAVDHVVAPEPIKQQARQQIRDAAAVDRYLADLGSKP